MVKFSSFKNRVFNSQEPTHEIRLVVVKKDLSRTLALGFIVVYNIFALILCTSTYTLAYNTYMMSEPSADHTRRF